MLSITELRLDNNQISDVGAMAIMGNLMLLNLTGNPLTPQAVSNLRQALPLTTILF